MAIGGRRTAAAWTAGVVALAVIGLLVWAAMPMLPGVGAWLAHTAEAFLEWLREITPRG